MLQPAIKTCLFQRKVGVRELDEEDPHTYVGFCIGTVTYMEVWRISAETDSDSLIGVCQRPSGIGGSLAEEENMVADLNNG